jgi:hypothetical protein
MAQSVVFTNSVISQLWHKSLLSVAKRENLDGKGEDIYEQSKVLRQYDCDLGFKDSFATLLDGLNS